MAGKTIAVNVTNLRRALQERGWTSHDLAAHSGCKAQTIARVEAGSSVSLQTLDRIARALRIPIENLVESAACELPPVGTAAPNCAADSIFISHSRHDMDIVQERIILFLRKLGMKVWYSEDSIRPSEKWVPSLVRGLEESKWFLLAMSPRSADSRWVNAEVHWATEHRPNHILPVLIEDCDASRFHLFIPQLQYVDLRRDSEHARRALAGALGLPHMPTTLNDGAPAVPKTPAVQYPVDREANAEERITDGVRLPRFHCGGVVPPDYFIGRERELQDAEEIIRAGQSFLIVGVRRAGKTSFCNKLQGRLLSTEKNDLLASRLNLEACRDLTIDTFLGHTILNMVGEIARVVFRLKPADLNRPDLAQTRHDLKTDGVLESFVNINRVVTERTHYRRDTPPSPFLPHEFVGFVADLLEILRAKGWRNYVLFYDEANHLPAQLSGEMLTGYLEILDAAALTTVYAASPEMVASFKPLHDHFGHHIRIGPFESQRDLMRLLARYYHGDMSKTDNLPISADAVQMIWDYAQGMPFQLQFLLSFSFEKARDEHASMVINRHVAEANVRLSRDRPDYFGTALPRV